MNETEQVRNYLEGQINTSKSRLKHYLGQKSEAETEVERLTKTLELLEGMLGYLKGEVPGEGGQAPPIEEEIQGAQPYAEMSIADAAHETLKTAGRPLHVSKIWKRLQQGGKTSEAEKPILSVTGALLRDDRFENLGRNTFTIRGVPSDASEKS